MTKKQRRLKVGPSASVLTVLSSCAMPRTGTFQRLASEVDLQTWVDKPLDEGERSLSDIADWGLAEDWADWSDATR